MYLVHLEFYKRAHTCISYIRYWNGCQSKIWQKPRSYLLEQYRQIAVCLLNGHLGSSKIHAIRRFEIPQGTAKRNVNDFACFKMGVIVPFNRPLQISISNLYLQYRYGSQIPIRFGTTTKKTVCQIACTALGVTPRNKPA